MANDKNGHKIVRDSVGRGRNRVCCVGITTEEGLIVSVLGGQHPHVGAVALAIPRPSLRDAQKRSVSTSVLTLVGHKDDELAKPISEKIAKKCNQVTVVVVGVHVENASEDDIKRLIGNSMRAVDKLLTKFEKTCSNRLRKRAQKSKIMLRK